MEFVTHEIFPATVASAAALVVVETTDAPHNSGIEPKTLALAVFRGTSCAVYSVCATNGVKTLLFEDWVGCRVTLAASTCDGSLTCLTDDLEIVIFTFDLIRRVVLKRFQSVLTSDGKTKVVRRSFTPSLVVAPSAGGKVALCHAHEGYIHHIAVKLILASEIATPFDGAIRRSMLSRYAPYALSFLATDHEQYVALYAADDKNTTSSNTVGSSDFYTPMKSNRVTAVVCQSIDDGRDGGAASERRGRSQQTVGVPFVAACLTRLRATAVVTDENVTLLVPEGGFSSPAVHYKHGIEALLSNRIAVTSIFDMSPAPSTSSSTVSSAAASSVLLGLSDGRYFKILLSNSADDCDSFCKEVDPFASWENPDDGTGASSSSSNSNNTEVSKHDNKKARGLLLCANAPPLVAWNYGNMVRGLVAGVNASNGDVFLMKPEAAAVLPTSVAGCHQKHAAQLSTSGASENAESHSGALATRLLRGVVTGVAHAGNGSKEVITSTSDGLVRRSHTVLDADVVATIPLHSSPCSSSSGSTAASLRPPSAVRYHSIPSAAVVAANEDEATTTGPSSSTAAVAAAIAVLSGADFTQFMLKSGAAGSEDEDLEMLFADDGSLTSSSSLSVSSSFVTNERTLAFGFTSHSEAVQITPSGIYWFSVSLSSSSPSLSVSLSSSVRGDIRLGYVTDDGAVAAIKAKEGGANSKRAHVLKLFARGTSEVTVIDLISFGEPSALCVMPSSSSEEEEKADVTALVSFWGGEAAASSQIAVASALAGRIIGHLPIAPAQGAELRSTVAPTLATSPNDGNSNSTSNLLHVAAMEPLNANWAIVQRSDGALFGRKVFSTAPSRRDTTTEAEVYHRCLDTGRDVSSIVIPLAAKATAQQTFIPSTLTVCRALSSIAVAGPTAVTVMTVRTANYRATATAMTTVATVGEERGDVSSYSTGPSASEAATHLVVASERRYAIPSPYSRLRNAHNNNNSSAFGLSTSALTSLAFFGDASELMRRPRLLVTAGGSSTAAPAAIVDLRTSYSHHVIDEVKVGYAVTDLLVPSPQHTARSAAAAAAERERAKASALAHLEVLMAKRRLHSASEEKEEEKEKKAVDGADAEQASSSFAGVSFDAAALAAPLPIAAEPFTVLAVVERPSVDPATTPSTFSLVLLAARGNVLCTADERPLPPFFIPSCSANSAGTLFSTGPAAGDQQQQTVDVAKTKATAVAALTTAKGDEANVGAATEDSDEKKKNEKEKKKSSPPSADAIEASTSSHLTDEPFIVIGGCDISNGSGKLITVTTAGAGAAFSSLAQTSLNGPVNAMTFSVNDKKLALVVATHFELHVFGYSSTSAASSSSPLKHMFAPYRTASPVLSLASSLSVIAAASSGLVTYFECVAGMLRERAVEILPNATQTAMAGADGFFVKCDSRRNLFVNAIADKSKKVAKMDSIYDKYSIPLKANTRLPSWAARLVVASDAAMGPKTDEDAHLTLNTAYESFFAPNGISKRFYVCGSDGSVSVLVRVPSELFRFLLRLEASLETYLDHDRRDYLINYYERLAEEALAASSAAMTGNGNEEKALAAAAEEAVFGTTCRHAPAEEEDDADDADDAANNLDDGNARAAMLLRRRLAEQKPQALWGRKDAKQCVSDCRTLRSANVVDLKTVNSTYFGRLSDGERRVLVTETLQPENSDLMTPASVAAILQRCVATL